MLKFILPALIAFSAQLSDKSPERFTRTIKIKGKTIDSKGKAIEGPDIILQLVKEKKLDSSDTIFYTRPDEKGKFSSEIQYKTDSSSKDILYIGFNSYMPLKNLKLYIEQFNYNVDEYYKAYFSNLCYAKFQKYELKDKDVNINTVFECHPTASLTINVSPKNENNADTFYFQSPEIMLEPAAQSYSFTNTNTFDVPAGIKFSIICARSGFADSIIKIDSLKAGEPKQIEVKMIPATHKFNGKCVDSDGKPVKFIRITVNQEGLTNSQTSTDQNGEFTINILEKLIKEIIFHAHCGNCKELRIKDVDYNSSLKTTIEKKNPDMDHDYTEKHRTEHE
ncbi:MAG: carboxypeptidase regulatory-like domain-containing protein [Planctomycetes bacterium]|nr:carboxypeptidase regulatory-like domain-containing protein [Planctomycetota bacterium]